MTDKRNDRAFDNQAEGLKDEIQGRVRNAAGGLTGNTGQQLRGKAQELKGKAQRKIGEAQEDTD